MIRRLSPLVLIVLAHALSLAMACAPQVPNQSLAIEGSIQAAIVQGTDLPALRSAVARAGGTVTHELEIISALGVRLTEAQRATLDLDQAVARIYDDQVVDVDGDSDSDSDSGSGSDSDSDSDGGGGGAVAPYTEYPSVVGAEPLHRQGITGDGVTVAVLDTGVKPKPTLAKNSRDGHRLLAQYDAIEDREGQALDWHGHGTHVVSVILNSQKPGNSSGSFNGIAPDADLVAVKAFGASGVGTYLDVIRGLDWVVRNKDLYGIRVLNLSISAEPRSHYWDDPLNQAVMAAWQAGIVVVASAGNAGPDPMTIGVPGNVPYVITAGAMSDGVTPETGGDDFLTSFSSAGPTVEGFVKPEVVAPGGHMLGLADSGDSLPSEHPEWKYDDEYFYMSGTSQAAAVASGVVALMLQADPSLAADDVKCRLMASARPAVAADGTLAYSVFQQGAGMIHAQDAVTATESGCANGGLDVAQDLAGTRHYGGVANQDENGDYFIMGLEGDGTVWSGGYMWTEGYLWTNAFLWTEGYLWTRAFLWTEGYLWTNADLWANVYPDGYLWTGGLAEPAAINVWVEQE